MPIVWTEPTVGQPFGPGFEYVIGTDLAGPWPVGSRWEFDIYPAVGEFSVSRQLIFTTNSQVFGKMGHNQVPLGLAEPRSALAAGAAARLVAVLYDNNGVIQDQGTLDIVWDPTSGAPWLLYQQLQFMQSFGAFNSGDRTSLNAIKAAVQLSVPLNAPGSGASLVGLGQLVTSVPHSWLSRSSPIVLSGNGSIDRPGALFGVDAYGCSWDFLTVPAGFGKAEGAVDEYHNRMLQLNAVKADGINHLFTAEINDIHTEGNYWIWGLSAPERLDYAIAPGVSINFYWLIFTVPI